jgi:hypothetical protein
MYTRSSSKLFLQLKTGGFVFPAPRRSSSLVGFIRRPVHRATQSVRQVRKAPGSSPERRKSAPESPGVPGDRLGYARAWGVRQ